MPLYDYRCRVCRHAFEALVFGGEAPECPECHGRRLERRPSSFAVGRGERREAELCGACGRVPGSCAAG